MTNREKKEKNKMARKENDRIDAQTRSNGMSIINEQEKLKIKEPLDSKTSDKPMEKQPDKQPLMSPREKAWAVVLFTIWFLYCLFRAIFDDNWWWR